jgi:signal transduction histidine kinase
VTREPRTGRTLRLRLLAAFVGVAAVAIAAFAGLTLWSGRSEVNDLVRRQQQTTVANTIAAVVDVYRATGGWSGADLRTARGIAVSGGALLEIRDRDGTLLLRAGRGLGPGGRGQPRIGAAYGSARAIPVVVDGATVGTASVRFPENTLPPAERQLRDALTRTTVDGVLIAVAAALLVGFVVAEGITRPLRRLITAVQQLGRGDRAARANLTAPGELGELAAAVDAMAAKLEREDELRRALTADVAHELRTPVTILTAQCEAILDGVTSPNVEQVGSLYEEVLRLGRVIEDLETLASAEAAGLRLERVPVDLAALVEETTRLLAPQFEAADVMLVTRIVPATVEGDPLRITQIVRNLLSNALKFTPTGGRVQVAVRSQDGHVELTVTDSGAGIVPDELPHVFDRFWRGTNSRKASGSGIGLAVVDQLVRAHGGQVHAANDPGGGAVFTVELPGR